MFNNILVVCVGNICRSPTAERLLQRYHPELKVESAGLGALVGKGADPTAISVAAEHQLSLEGHCARQISRRLCRNYDLILTMEKRHIERLCEMAPEMRGKVMLFGHWDNEYEFLQKRLEGLLSRLRSNITLCLRFRSISTGNKANTPYQGKHKQTKHKSFHFHNEWI